MTSAVTGAKIARIVRFDALLLSIVENEWVTPAFVALDRDGRVVSITNRAPDVAEPHVRTENVTGWALPGFVNAHSHTFQYAMAGLTECLAPGKPDDTFWSWRERMYQLALQLTPGEVKTIATIAFREMLRRGFTSVVEFHYLVNRPDGKPYTNTLEIASAIAEAAKVAGIDLMLAPVYYNQGGFGRAPLPEQRRFLFPSVSAYQKHFSQLSKFMTVHGNRTAIAVHSLRAAKPEDVRTLFTDAPRGTIKHMHVAEQQAEVDDALAALKCRPVEWLLENVPLDHTCNFVHGTHVTSDECRGLARQGANVVLCPSTEGNLGDGIFPLPLFIEHGGRFAIGTDSHVSLCPFEELRWLEYGQRLVTQRRNILLREYGEDSGRTLAARAIHGGRMAAGLGEKPFHPGESFDAIVIDPKHHALWNMPTAHLWSALIFGHGARALTATMVAGQWSWRQDHEGNDHVLYAEWKKLAAKIRGQEAALPPPKKRPAAAGSSRRKP